MADTLELNDDQKAHLSEVYGQIHADAGERGAGSKFVRMSERYRDGHWERTVKKLGLFSRPLAGGTFMDFGCKFGHLTPLLTEYGVTKVFSVDVDEEHLRDGAAFIGSRFGSEYVMSDDCYLDVPSNSVDFILVNEVISHINPTLLPIFYQETARVLTVGGEMVISDGNNWSNKKTRDDLIEWYELWDSGTSKEFGESNYTKQRYVMIKNAFKARRPRLTPEEIEYYARNTAGLFGDRLIETVRRALDEGRFTERPYRPGMPPIHPRYGVAMERAFYPLEVELSLRTYGLMTQQVIGTSKPRPLNSEEERGRYKNFVIRATKLPETQEAMKQFAAEDHYTYDPQ
jgi:SAM-dependent methyltransferase